MQITTENVQEACSILNRTAFFKNSNIEFVPKTKALFVHIGPNKNPKNSFSAGVKLLIKKGVIVSSLDESELEETLLEIETSHAKLIELKETIDTHQKNQQGFSQDEQQKMRQLAHSLHAKFLVSWNPEKLIAAVDLSKDIAIYDWLNREAFSDEDIADEVEVLHKEDAVPPLKPAIQSDETIEKKFNVEPVNINSVIENIQSYVQNIHKPTRWYQKPFRWLQKLFAPVRALKDAIRQQFVEDLNHINTENPTEAVALLKAKLNGLEHAQSYIEIVRARKHKGESVLEIAKGYLANPERLYAVKPTSPQAERGLKIEAQRKEAMLKLVM